MVSRLETQIAGASTALTLMPLFHTAEAIDARSYVEALEINQTDECEVFKAYLNYFFYGRPAYKFATPEGATNNLSYFPVCFVLKPTEIDLSWKIFPFDSGAFYHQRFVEFINKKMKLPDFQVEPNADGVRRVVSTFFGTNQNYIEYKSSDVKIDPAKFESVALHNMIKAPFQMAATDERRATIEIIRDTPVAISDKNLLAVIMPVELMDDPLFANLASFCEVKTYDTGTWNPQHSFGQVASLAKDMIRVAGY